uniref:Borealin C-terminal domain-containing protein n=1 Tax=Glossina morsitans morsitans TaxID=37546 RepID=A0A1B0G8A6_GLOMM
MSDITFDAYCADIDNDIEAFIEEWDGELDLLRQRTSAKLLKMKMGDFLKINSNTLEDAPLDEPVHLIPMQSNKPVSVSDEGYLTKDTSRPCSSAPLNSARARCSRRSRSACDEHSSSIGMEHGDQNKMLCNRSRIHSVERTRKICLEGHIAVDCLYACWPKPREMVVSKYGSPVIAQTLADRFANPKIPLRGGAMSLRPKKLDEVQADILERYGPSNLE